MACTRDDTPHLPERTRGEKAELIEDFEDSVISLRNWSSSEYPMTPEAVCELLVKLSALLRKLHDVEA